MTMMMMMMIIIIMIMRYYGPRGKVGPFLIVIQMWAAKGPKRVAKGSLWLR